MCIAQCMYLHYTKHIVDHVLLVLIFFIYMLNEYFYGTDERLT